MRNNRKKASAKFSAFYVEFSLCPKSVIIITLTYYCVSYEQLDLGVKLKGATSHSHLPNSPSTFNKIKACSKQEFSTEQDKL